MVLPFKITWPPRPRHERPITVPAKEQRGQEDQVHVSPTCRGYTHGQHFKKKRSKGGKYLKDTRIYLGNVKKPRSTRPKYAQKGKQITMQYHTILVIAPLNSN